MSKVELRHLPICIARLHCFSAEVLNPDRFEVFVEIGIASHRLNAWPDAPAFIEKLFQLIIDEAVAREEALAKS